MVGIIALYHQWTPFLMTIAYVVLHHGVVGLLAPTDVFNHPAAWARPWRWAALHGLFITAMSLVSLVSWRLNEGAAQEIERRRVVADLRASRLRTLAVPPSRPGVRVRGPFSG